MIGTKQFKQKEVLIGCKTVTLRFDAGYKNNKLNRLYTILNLQFHFIDESIFFVFLTP
jgi:hypothetical protein